ncbi:histone-lysine N-methyltransferase SETMAR [Trichonephila clavipes]|nr:histone-lysine N-methyltransferase SETMAR [Trichonephila clavipes]
MDISKKLVRSSKRTYQSLHQVTEYSKRLWIWLSMNVRQGIDFKNSGWEICPSVIKLEQDGPHALDDEALLHLQRLSKTYRLSKGVSHTLLEVHKQQLVAACLSLLSRHQSASIFNRVLTSDEKWVLHDTPKRSKHWLSTQDTIPHSARSPMHLRKMSGGLVVKWFTMSCY